MNIIAVDDEPLALSNILKQLSALFPGGVGLQGFEDYEKAEAYIKDHACEIAFLDIAVGEEQAGIVFGQKLKARCPQANIIFVTGYHEHTGAAMDMHASGYIMKPVTRKKLEKELTDLRYPVIKEKRVRIQAFGDFQIYIDEEPICFRYQKTKEMLAVLVDRHGAMCTKDMMITVLWEDVQDTRSKSSYLRNLRQDLINTLKQYGCEEILAVSRGEIAVKPDAVNCDYFQWLAGDRQGRCQYQGEYMAQYSWAEQTKGALDFSTGKVEEA